MYLDRVVGLQADFHLEHVAGVNNAQPIRCVAVESIVTHGERLAEDRAGMPAPRTSPTRILIKCGHRAVKRGGVFVISRAQDQVRPAQGIAQIVVKTTRAGIGPVHDRIDLRQSRRFPVELLDRLKLTHEPEPVVQHLVDRVEGGTAADVDRLVTGYAQLHANALE